MRVKVPVRGAGCFTVTTGCKQARALRRAARARSAYITLYFMFRVNETGRQASNERKGRWGGTVMPRGERRIEEFLENMASANEKAVVYFVQVAKKTKKISVKERC